MAVLKSVRWSSPAFPMGLLDLAVMPSHLPPRVRVTKAGPLPSSGLLHRRQRYYGPLGLTNVRNQKAELLNLRLLKEIEAETFAAKKFAGAVG